MAIATWNATKDQEIWSSNVNLQQYLDNTIGQDDIMEWTADDATTEFRLIKEMPVDLIGQAIYHAMERLDKVSGEVDEFLNGKEIDDNTIGLFTDTDRFWRVLAVLYQDLIQKRNDEMKAKNRARMERMLAAVNA